MPTSTVSTLSLGAYQLHLPSFEGPLDVLLRLIEREQLPISEVSLIAVLDQFLAFLEGLDNPPPQVIADFVAVAGRLSVLKSRSLLPRPAVIVEEPEEEDLVRQLAEYRAVKAAAALLDDRQRAGHGAYERGDGIDVPEAVFEQLPLQAPTALLRALRRWKVRLPTPSIPVPAHRVVSLREMVSRIVHGLESHARLPFHQIFAGARTRQEVAVAFLAVLTLMRRQTISATQAGLFGEITLTRAVGPTRMAANEMMLAERGDDDESSAD